VGHGPELGKVQNGSRTRKQYHRIAWPDVSPERNRGPNEAVPPDRGHFHHLSSGKADRDGDSAAMRQIDLCGRGACRDQDSFPDHFDGLEVRMQRVELRGRQGLQQIIRRALHAKASILLPTRREFCWLASTPVLSCLLAARI